MAKTAIGADRAIMLKHGLGSQAEEVVGGRADMEARFRYQHRKVF